MQPAFRKDRDLLGYVAMLALCLLLPVILLALGPTRRQDVYKLHEETGPMAAMGREIFERHSDLDFLFFGASIIRAAIAPDLIDRQIEVTTGKKPATLLCGPNWQGLDIQYLILRDFLAHRKVHYLFLNLPDGVTWPNKPHIGLDRILRLGDDPGFYSHLSFVHVSEVYAAEILGTPRQLLSLIRPNLVGEDEAGLLDRLRKSPGPLLGYYGSPAVEDHRKPPLLPGEEMIHEGSTDGGWFRFQNRPLGDYQMAFLAKIGELARNHHTSIVILNIPIDSDRGRLLVVERMDWSKVLGVPVTVMGIPPSQLFPDMTADEFHHFFGDQHLNQNGRRYYTAAIIPGLRKLLERTSVQP